MSERRENIEKKIARIQLQDDDCVFFLNTFSGKNPFRPVIEDQLNRKAYRGKIKSLDEIAGSSLVIGKLSHWKKVIEDIDKNPVMITAVQEPFENFIKGFFQNNDVFKRKDLAGADKKEFNQEVRKYLADPKFSKMINNPQSNLILGLHDVWSEGLSKAVNKKTKWHLIKERIQQMAFVGVIEYFDLSLDLFKFIFYAENKNYEKAVPKKKNADVLLFKEILSPKLLDHIKKRIIVDIRLYELTKTRLLEHYRQMALRPSIESGLKLGGYQVKVYGLDDIGGFEMKLIKAFRKIRKFIFPPGSKRAKKMKEALQSKKSIEKKKIAARVTDKKRAILTESRTGEDKFSLGFIIRSPDPEDQDTLRTMDSINLMERNPALSQIDINVLNITEDKSFIQDLPKKYKGDYLVFLDAGDLVSKAFCENFGRTLLDGEPADVYYCDTDHNSHPWYKPHTYSPEMLLNVNYLKYSLYKREFLLKGKFDEIGSPMNEAAEWKLALTCGESEASIAHIPEVMVHSKFPRFGKEDISFETQKAIQKVLEGHLLSQGYGNPIVEFDDNKRIRTQWETDKSALVSIIIPTRNNLKHIRKCVNSIVEITDQANYEIIVVDNGSTDKKLISFYSQITKNSNIKIVNYDKSFNYSEANNLGAREAAGKYLLFLNDDTEITHPDWLSELVMWAAKPGIGVVGPKLLYPDGSIQFYGTVLGLTGHAGHIFAGMDENSDSIYGSTNWVRNCTAVTGACMLIPKDVFLESGGFNEEYQLTFSDVEICLKILELGYRIVCTPFSTVRHFEGGSRAKNVPLNDSVVALRNFGKYIEAGDKYFNSNLSLDDPIPSIKSPEEEDRILNIVRNQVYTRIDEGS